jgi:hypothetical protein
MAFLPEQPGWPSHVSADKLGMRLLFTARNERTVVLDRVQQRALLKRTDDTAERRSPIRPNDGY